jgi:predicted nucleic acid-binding protein
MQLAVVDASVALAWVIPEEKTGPQAVQLLLSYQGNQVRLLAPSLWEYEVANALKVGVLRKRLSPEEGKEALNSLLGLGIALTDFSEVADTAWELALAQGLSIYDAAYLALAQHRNCRLYTADKRLLEAGKTAGLTEWIGEK